MRYYTTAQLSENIHKTPEGFLICKDVPIARTGEMIYLEGETPLECDDDGQVLIEREEDEVFRPETMASFEGKPVTIGHPPDAVTPENWARLAVGIIQNVRRSGEDLIADFLITVKEAIDRILSGLREVSCGYDADYTQTKPGYGFQSNIVGNHVALVREGRAGSAYAINDEKGKSVDTKIAEKAKAILSKAMTDIDALAAAGAKADKSGMTGKAGKTGKTGDKKAADADNEDDDDDDKKKRAKAGGTEDEEAPSMSDLAAAIKALSAKVDSLGKGTKDKESAETEDADEENEESDTSGNDDDSDVMARLDKLEQAVAKLLEAKDNEDDTSVEEEANEFNDSASEGGAVGSEDAMPKSTLTGDAAKFEILAPGKKFSGKNAKALALKAAFATDDGKAVITRLTGKKTLTTDNAATTDLLFNAVADLLAESRQENMSQTRKGKVSDESVRMPKGPLTPEQINKINAEYYGSKH